MKTTIFALAALISVGAFSGAFAQSNCTTRCGNQFTTCLNADEAALEECLDRATTAREKAKCAADFKLLEDACRTKEAACLSNCPTS